MSNFFNLLNLEQIFDIDKDELHKNYIKLQQVLHPDKQINKSHVEKIMAMEYATKLNNAYQTLSDDKKRAEYLLSLDGIIINQEEGNNVAPDPIMLNEILEISENPESYNISLMKEEAWNIFKRNYIKRDLQEAAQSLIKLQYLNKIKSSAIEVI